MKHVPTGTHIQKNNSAANVSEFRDSLNIVWMKILLKMLMVVKVIGDEDLIENEPPIKRNTVSEKRFRLWIAVNEEEDVDILTFRLLAS